MNTSKSTWLLMIILLCLCLEACQKNAPPTDPSAPRGPLESLNPSDALVIYWYAWTGSTEDLLLEMIADFNASNPWEITVIGEYQGSYQDLYQEDVATWLEITLQACEDSLAGSPQ